MNSTLPLSSSKSPLIFSSFTHPNPIPSLLPPKFFRLPVSSNLKRHRFRVLKLRCSSEQASSPSPTITTTTSTGSSADVFGPPRELSGIQSLVDSLSPPVRLASSVLVVVAASAAGYGLGSRFGGTRNIAIGGAVALGAVGGAAAYALNSCVPEVAATNLHNYVAQCDDPLALNKEEILAIANRYGVNKQDEAFNAELCDLYLSFISSVLPGGNEDLKGDEVETIIKFKNALGIEDPDAAKMHIELARRIFRQRLETGDRDGDIEQRRAFQKLMYVSTRVFGEASAFLLPWKRVFKVTDSQLSKELDEEMFKEHARKAVEECISRALEFLKSRTRAGGNTELVQELNKKFAFNDMLLSLRNHPNAANFACGIGPVSLVGDNGQRNWQI